LKKSFPFILLNIFISLATTLVVLLIWDRAHKVKDVQVTPGPQTTQSISLIECTGTVPKANENVIAITNIIGSGDLYKEEVDLHYSGQKEFCLNGWNLVNQRGDEYSFPSFFQLYTQGLDLKIFSRSGANSPLELYWGLAKAVWKSGDTARLIDPEGTERSIYKIP
jgi:hypothetical protein